MTNLNPLELERLKSLLSGQALTLGEKISTLDMLRFRLPGFFSNLKPELTEENLKDNNFLIKYLTNPYNRNKIKNALRQELSLSTTQQIELEQSLEEPTATEIVSGQPGEQAATAEQPLPAGPATGAPIGGMPGLPSAPRISFGSRRVYNAPHTPKPPPPKSELVVANKSGVIQEAPSGAKLVTATSSGAIKEAPPKQIFTANERGVVTGVRNIKPPSSPSWLKTFGSNSQIFFKRNLGKVWDGLKGIGSGLGRGLAGGIGGGLETAAPSLGRMGHGLANGLQRISAPGGIGGGGIGTGLSKSSNKLALGLIGALLFMVLIGGLLGGLTGTTPPGQAGPLPPGGGGDISNCKFTRGGDSVKELTYKSPLLLGYIQEASTLTSIPSVVLAAFIRVETPSTVTKNDDEIRNLSSVANCPRSETGALGVMQLQPQGTKGHDVGAITNGARLIGKSYDQLTEEDYCDVRKNVIMGAGFILKKMSYTTKDYPSYGDGTKWDSTWTNNRTAIEKLVNGYYGCLVYGGPDPQKCEGPFNYADDVWTSIQNCQVNTVPPGPVLSTILAWDQKIVDGLEAGIWGLFNKLATAITNGTYSTGIWYGADEPTVYWCTYSIIDSYNLAGISGLSKGAHAAVITMRQFWSQSSGLGYKYLDYRTDNTLLKSAQPGYAIFMEAVPGSYTGHEHVALMKIISFDDRGNGVIETNDSNSGQKSNRYPVVGWSITNTPYTVTGFGGI